MFVEFPARSEDQIRPVSVNPALIVAVTAAGQDSCEVLTTVRSFWVQLPYREVIRRLAASATEAGASTRGERAT